MYDIIAIGKGSRDGFVKADFELTKWKETPSGRAIVLPLGEKIGIDEIYFSAGGGATNASVTFARQGLKTAALAKIGDDVSGQEIVRHLKEENVATELIAYSREKPTAYGILLLKDGARTILSYHGATNTFSIADIDFDKIKAAWWYISLSGQAHRLYSDLIEFAKKENIKTAFNSSGYQLKHNKKEILTSLKDLDFLVMNEEEAAELVGISFRKEKEVFAKIDELMSPGIVAVTSGPQGVKVSDGKNIYAAGIFKEKKIVDRTGAGDAFASGFTTALARGGSIEKAIRLGSANATAVVERIGGHAGALTREEFETSPRWRDLQIKKTRF